MYITMQFTHIESSFTSANCIQSAFKTISLSLEVNFNFFVKVLLKRNILDNS